MDDDLDRRTFLVPYSVAVRARDPEDVAPGVEIRVMGEAPVGSGVGPVAVETLESIGVAVLARAGEVEGGELEREDRLAMGELDSASLTDRAIERRAGIEPPDGDGRVEQPEIGDRDRRRMGVVGDALGPKDAESADATEEELAAGAAEAGADGEDVAREAVGDVVVAEALRVRVEPAQAAVGGEPEMTPVVFQDPQNCIVGQAVLFAEAGEPPAGLVEPVEVEPVEAGAESADPEAAVAILVDGGDLVARQAVAVAGSWRRRSKRRPSPSSSPSCSATAGSR